MKNYVISIALILVYIANIHAQINMGGNYDPDSLIEITKSGTVIVDSSVPDHLVYSLDENNDGSADYYLNFGPAWYEPDSSNAVRPNNGDQITVTGGLHESINGLHVIVVYDINNEFWRDPYSPFWNNMGTHNHNGQHHSGECGNYSFGFDHDSLQSINISGTVMIDSTFYMDHYYLDIDNDELPDYILNFGPYWYEPLSGANRPADGDNINIIGGQMQNGLFPMILVYEIDGEVWLDSSNVGEHFGGGWFYSNSNTAMEFHNLFDEDDNILVNPGWHMGGMMSDSLFCQLLELYPENIPGAQSENAFAGFEIGMYSSNGQNNMSNNIGCGGHMNFGTDFQVNFHLSARQMSGINLLSNTIVVKSLNDQTQSWDIINSVFDSNSNSISFSTSELSSYYILSTANATAITENQLPQNFSLKQNYPNPFNPSTIIEFNLSRKETVKLTVYNLLGEVVKELFNGILPAGTHKFSFNARTLSSGIYLYKLSTDNFTTVKKMELLK